MTNPKLYGSKENFRVQKVLVAAKIAGKQVTVTDSAPPSNQFPLGLTPAFEDGNVVLFGAEAISKHLVGTGTSYAPHSPEVAQWLVWGEGQLLPNVLSYVLPSVSAAHFDSGVVEQARKELLGQLKAFNTVLLHKTFLVGERLSIADVSVALDLLPAYQHVLDSNVRNGIGNVNRWFLTVLNHPAVKEVVGEFHFIEKAATFDEETYKKFVAAAAAKDKKGGEKPAAQPAQPKAQKGKKKEEEDEEDADDEVKAAEPKFVDPLQSMPAGTFNMDAFKRCYSNEDTATKAIPHFWENFDPENYSVWYCEYKYPEDLTQVFMSCNLISGMFQRLEKLKKHAFASVILFGENNKSTISGMWVWRGHQLAFELCPDWQVDYESYSWKKLDAKSEADKKAINEYLLWEGDFNGQKLNQGKIFK